MRTLSHIGIPSAEKLEGMAFIEPLKVHITDHAASPNKLEFLYFEPDSPMHPLIQSRAHVAYNVEDINAALEGTKILLPALDCGNMTIAFIEEEGTAIELIELK